MRMRTFMLLLMVFTMNLLFAQEHTITGIVVDGSMGDDPLPGATVSIMRGNDKKVTQGTVTDYDGKFSLKVDAKDKTFQVRFLGFETQDVKIIAGKTDYRVVLQSDDKVLSEVVVTGYQELDRRKLTSAVTTLKIDDEKIGAVKNIDQALAGQIAGLSSITATGAPGAPVKIRIRGTASINGTQEPLWVLDGIPMELCYSLLRNFIWTRQFNGNLPLRLNLNSCSEAYPRLLQVLNALKENEGLIVPFY